jgi:hypothetical protein
MLNYGQPKSLGQYRGPYVMDDNVPGYSERRAKESDPGKISAIVVRTLLIVIAILLICFAFYVAHLWKNH